MDQLPNGKLYVGSTLNFYTRILSYFYLTGAYGILLNAFNKYGFNVFTLVLIAIPDPSKELVLELEQYVLDTFSPEYNIQPFANSSAGRILTPPFPPGIPSGGKVSTRLR